MSSRDALGRHPLAIAGALITAVSAAVFVALVIAAAAGLFTNPYAGLVVFILLPAGVVLGLGLLAAGVRRQRRAPGGAAAAAWPVLDFGRADVRRATLALTGVTAGSLVILLLAGYGGLHWMESPTFCGQVCHTPMKPQFTAWGGSIHGRIPCVRCHIGEGVSGFVHAKLSGVRQLAEVATTSYPRPIPPGAAMAPGAQARTCVTCHQTPSRTGDQLRVIHEYADDEANSETTTVLRMHTGSVSGSASGSGRAIHWHADPAVRVEYVAEGDAAETIPYVRVTRPDGRVTEYRATEGGGPPAGAVWRVMGCVDCHNTVGHPTAPTPERAVDTAIALGHVSRQLPYVRREGVRLVSASYSSQEEGLAAIDRGLRSFYRPNPSVDAAALDRSVAGLQEVYRTNVFPAMKVTWESYPDHNGHLASPGCLRCHDDSHKAPDGSTISGDCEFCHTQIETPE